MTLTVGSRFDTRPEAGAENSSFESNDWFLDHRGTGGADPHPDPARPDPGAEQGRPSASLSGPVPGLRRDLPAGRRLDRAAAAPGGRTVRRRRPSAVAGAQRLSRGDAAGRRPGRRAGSVRGCRHQRFPCDLRRVDRRGRRAPRRGRGDRPVRRARWDSSSLQLTGNVAASGHLSAAVLIDATNPGGGLRFTVTANADGSGTLAAHPLAGGPAIASQAIAALPETISLRVDVFADRIRATAAGVTVGVDRGRRCPALCEIGGAQAGIVSLYRSRARDVRLRLRHQPLRELRRPHRHRRRARPAAGRRRRGLAWPRYWPGWAARSPRRCARTPPTAIASGCSGKPSGASPSRSAKRRSRCISTLRRPAPTAGSCWRAPEPIDLVEEVALDLRRRVPLPPIDPALVARSAPPWPTCSGRCRCHRPARRARPRAPAGADAARRDHERWAPARQAAMTGRQPLDRRPSPAPGRSPRSNWSGTASSSPRWPRVSPRPGRPRDFSRAESVALRRGHPLLRPRGPPGRLDPPRRERMAGGRPGGHPERRRHASATDPAGRPAERGYRLQFEITRRWFDTSAPVGPDNAYQGQATLEFTLA